MSESKTGNQHGGLSGLKREVTVTSVEEWRKLLDEMIKKNVESFAYVCNNPFVAGGTYSHKCQVSPYRHDFFDPTNTGKSYLPAKITFFDPTVAHRETTDLKPDNKAELSLVPWPAIELAAKGFKIGSELSGYPPGNYLNPKPGETVNQHVGRYISAGLRHGFKAAMWYVFGDKRHEKDEKTGLDHLAHALNNFMMAVHIKDVRESNEANEK